MNKLKNNNKNTKTSIGTSKFHKQTSFPRQQTAGLSPMSSSQGLNPNKAIHV